MNIIVKGIYDDLLLVLPFETWELAANALFEKIEDQSSFFKGASVYLDVQSIGMRVSDITETRAKLDRSGITLKGILSKTDQTIQNAKTLGLETALHEKQQRNNPKITQKEPAVSKSKSTCFYLPKTVRSGTLIEKMEDVVVIGDINPGAEVSSAGNITVWGKIRGKVHAGINGNNSALIRALEIETAQITISETTRFFEKEPHTKSANVPIVLLLKNNEITIKTGK